MLPDQTDPSVAPKWTLSYTPEKVCNSGSPAENIRRAWSRLERKVEPLAVVATPVTYLPSKGVAVELARAAEALSARSRRIFTAGFMLVLSKRI